MINVNDKELEVGDTVVFRCGGEAVILEIADHTEDYSTNYSHKLKTINLVELEYSHLNYHSSNELLDINDIKKKPKPVNKDLIAIEDLEYYINNPSAWISYDDSLSEKIRAVVKIACKTLESK